MGEAAAPGGEIRRCRSTETCDTTGRGIERRRMEGCGMRVVFSSVLDLCGVLCVCVSVCVCVCVCVC
jgi:hypothetical protein